ncbi:MAG: hypothetical protein LBV19_08220 [Streptococcaceae bacterium]|jgi:hypothetical protein|nr:hypothetical protein [Streptococcaceae bacterium]
MDKKDYFPKRNDEKGRKRGGFFVKVRKTTKNIFQKKTEKAVTEYSYVNSRNSL